MILDAAAGEIYYAQLVEQESTMTVMVELRMVIERQGLFCALYSDRGSHVWLTPKAGGKVDPHRLTQVGRALRELGVQMIPPSRRRRGAALNRHPGGGQQLPRRALCGRVQSPLPGARGAARNRLRGLPAQGSGPGLLASVRTRRQQGQHRQLPKPQLADRAGQLAWNAGWLHRDDAPAPGRATSP